jgi:chaperone modulatory protein CbpM
MANDSGYGAHAVVVEEHLEFTLPDLCRASGAGADELLALVQEGVLDPQGGSGPLDWRFSGRSLGRARQTLRVARELDISLAGAAVVMELMAQIQDLRSRLRRGGAA